MSAGAPQTGLADRLVGWMAEGGTLPDRRARMERAREASARTWMRHLARGFEDVWDGAERRGAELAAHCRLFAEALATEAEPLADELRVSEAAAVWAHVRLLAQALEHALGARPEAPG